MPRVSHAYPIYPSTSLLHLRCFSSGHASRLIFLLFSIPVRDRVGYSVRAVTLTLVILDILIVHVMVLLLLPHISPNVGLLYLLICIILRM